MIKTLDKEVQLAIVKALRDTAIVGILVLGKRAVGSFLDIGTTMDVEPIEPLGR